MKHLIVSITALALVTATPAASTAGEKLAQGEHVSYGDLDLTRTSDLATFDSRLSAAVQKVCRPDYAGGQVRFEYVRRCRVGTQASLVAPRAAAIETSRLRIAARPVVVAAAR